MTKRKEALALWFLWAMKLELLLLLLLFPLLSFAAAVVVVDIVVL